MNLPVQIQWNFTGSFFAWLYKNTTKHQDWFRGCSY